MTDIRQMGGMKYYVMESDGLVDKMFHCHNLKERQSDMKDKTQKEI